MTLRAPTGVCVHTCTIIYIRLRRFPGIPFEELDRVVAAAGQGSFRPRSKARVPTYVQTDALITFAGPYVWLANELRRYFPTEESLGGEYEVTPEECQRAASAGSKAAARGRDGGWTPDLVDALLRGAAGEEASAAAVLVFRIMFQCPGPPAGADADYDRLFAMLLLLPTWLLGGLGDEKGNHQAVVYSGPGPCMTAMAIRGARGRLRRCMV